MKNLGRSYENLKKFWKSGTRTSLAAFDARLTGALLAVYSRHVTCFHVEHFWDCVVVQTPGSDGATRDAASEQYAAARWQLVGAACPLWSVRCRVLRCALPLVASRVVRVGSVYFAAGCFILSVFLAREVFWLRIVERHSVMLNRRHCAQLLLSNVVIIIVSCEQNLFVWHDVCFC